MMTYMLVNYLKNQPFFCKFVSMISPQKVAIIGSDPQFLFLKKKLLEDKREGQPLEIFQFGRESDHQDNIVDHQMNAPLLKTILRKINPSSIYIRENCTPHVLYKELNGELNKRLGLKHIPFDVESVAQVDGKTDIITKAQTLSCGANLGSKTFKGFDMLLTSEEPQQNLKLTNFAKIK